MGKPIQDKTKGEVRFGMEMELYIGNLAGFNLQYDVLITEDGIK